jgi:hypothetical protein
MSTGKKPSPFQPVLSDQRQCSVCEKVVDKWMTIHPVDGEGPVYRCMDCNSKKRKTTDAVGPSAYRNFTKSARPKIKADNPHLTSIAIMKVVHDQWKAMTSEQQGEYDKDKPKEDVDEQEKKKKKPKTSSYTAFTSPLDPESGVQYATTCYRCDAKIIKGTKIKTTTQWNEYATKKYEAEDDLLCYDCWDEVRRYCRECGENWVVCDKTNPNRYFPMCEVCAPQDYASSAPDAPPASSSSSSSSALQDPVAAVPPPDTKAAYLSMAMDEEEEPGYGRHECVECHGLIRKPNEIFFCKCVVPTLSTEDGCDIVATHPHRRECDGGLVDHTCRAKNRMKTKPRRIPPPEASSSSSAPIAVDPKEMRDKPSEAGTPIGWVLTNMDDDNGVRFLKSFPFSDEEMKRVEEDEELIERMNQIIECPPVADEKCIGFNRFTPIYATDVSVVPAPSSAPVDTKSHEKIHNVVVKNLPLTITESALLALFDTGDVVCLSIKTDRDTGRPTGDASIGFRDPTSARIAVAMWNNQSILGKPISVCLEGNDAKTSSSSSAPQAAAAASSSDTKVLEAPVAPPAFNPAAYRAAVLAFDPKFKWNDPETCSFGDVLPDDEEVEEFGIKWQGFGGWLYPENSRSQEMNKHGDRRREFNALDAKRRARAKELNDEALFKCIDSQRDKIKAIADALKPSDAKSVSAKDLPILFERSGIELYKNSYWMAENRAAVPFTDKELCMARAYEPKHQEIHDRLCTWIRTQRRVEFEHIDTILTGPFAQIIRFGD